METVARSRSLPAGLVRRADVILRSATGMVNRDVARDVGLSVPMVMHWRRRFHRLGIAGLHDAPRSGRPRTHDDDTVARLLRTVSRTTPTAATHGSTRTAAEKTGISKSTVQRYFQSAAKLFPDIDGSRVYHVHEALCDSLGSEFAEHRFHDARRSFRYAPNLDALRLCDPSAPIRTPSSKDTSNAESA